MPYPLLFPDLRGELPCLQAQFLLCDHFAYSVQLAADLGLRSFIFLRADIPYYKMEVYQH